MSSKTKAAMAALLLFSIVGCYYLIFSNEAFLNDLGESNRLLYAFISTLIMIVLGFLIGLAWDFLDKSSGSKGNVSMESDSNGSR